jgi:hypothetical protein
MFVIKLAYGFCFFVISTSDPDPYKYCNDPEHCFLRELRGLRVDLLVKEPDEVVVNGLVAIVLGSLLNTQLVPQPEQAVQSFSYCSLQRNGVC